MQVPGKSGENANKYYKNRVYCRISTLLQNICVTLHTLFIRIHTIDRPINRIKVMMKIPKLLEVDINELLRFDEFETPKNKDQHNKEIHYAIK